MKHYCYLLLFCCFGMMLGACSDDDKVNEVVYQPAFSFSFEVKDDLPEICSRIDLYYTGPDGNKTLVALNAGNNYRWKETFLGDKLPDTAGYEVLLFLKGDNELVKDRYTITILNNVSLSLYGNDGSYKLLNSSFAESSGTYPKIKLAEVLDRTKEDLNYYYEINKDGRYKKFDVNITYPPTSALLGDWSKSIEFGGSNRVSAVSFKSSKGSVYVGMGLNTNSNKPDQNLTDFWKFDGNSWKRVENGNFPDPIGGRTGSVAFVIGNRAYVGTGWRQGYSGDKTDRYFSNFYVFNTDTETWEKDGDEYLTYDIRDFAEDSMDCAFHSGIAFSLDGKGYVGTGQTAGRVLQSIYRFDPQTGKWESAGFEGDNRYGAVTFTIGKQAIICLGTSGAKNVSDVWAFDGNTWTPKAPLADGENSWDDEYSKIPRSYAVAFTSNLNLENGDEKGYIGGGISKSNTCWEYNIKTDRWHEVTNFPVAMNSMRVGPVGFSINGYGYITTGGASLEDANDNSTWRFTPGIDEDDSNDY